MICSEDELELQPDRSAGVILLEKEFSDVDFAKKLGEPFHSLSLPFITAG